MSNEQRAAEVSPDPTQWLRVTYAGTLAGRNLEAAIDAAGARDPCQHLGPATTMFASAMAAYSRCTASAFDGDGWPVLVERLAADLAPAPDQPGRAGQTGEGR